MVLGDITEYKVRVEYFYALNSVPQHDRFWQLKFQNHWEDLTVGDCNTVRSREAALSLLKPSFLDNNISGD